MANQPLVCIAFFSKRHIPLLKELRYDYGMSNDTGEVDEDGSRVFRGKTVCLCGSGNCHVDGSTPIEATPFSYLIPSFADDDNHQMENISSPTSQVVTPLQSPNRCIRCKCKWRHHNNTAESKSRDKTLQANTYVLL
ncbi:hypothetical protein YC2023_070408 [Brassica napus]